MRLTVLSKNWAISRWQLILQGHRHHHHRRHQALRSGLRHHRQWQCKTRKMRLTYRITYSKFNSLAEIAL